MVEWSEGRSRTDCPHSTVCITIVHLYSAESLIVTDLSETIKAINSFKSRSSCGPCGFRPLHLKLFLLYCTNLADNNCLYNRFIAGLTRLCNLLFSGLLPKPLHQIFSCSTLIAFNKPAVGGRHGIRPISIGLCIRRLAGKLAVSHIRRLKPNLLLPHQIGFACPYAIEAAVHSARHFLNCLAFNEGLLCLDFCNAFGNLSRTAMFEAVYVNLSLLYNYAVICYGQTSVMMFGDRVILSALGIGQGCNLSGIFWGLTSKPLLDLLTSRLHFAYCDDFTLGGAGSDLLTDLQYIITNGPAIGLRLNFSKSQLFTLDPGLIEQALLIAPGLSINPPAQAQLLGISLFPTPGDVLQSKLQQYRIFVDQIPFLNSHDALFLLIKCFGHSKIMHLLRTNFSIDPEFLHNYDNLSRFALELIYGQKVTDQQWLDASRPIKFGGIGLRSVYDLHLPAYLSSRFASQDLTQTLLHCDIIGDQFAVEALHDWQAFVGGPFFPDDRNSQSAWDKIYVLVTARICSTPLPLAHSSSEALTSAFHAPHAPTVPTTFFLDAPNSSSRLSQLEVQSFLTSYFSSSTHV